MNREEMLQKLTELLTTHDTIRAQNIVAELLDAVANKDTEIKVMKYGLRKFKDPNNWHVTADHENAIISYEWMPDGEPSDPRVVAARYLIKE